MTISPGATSRSISRSASRRPKNLVTPRTLIDADTSPRVSVTLIADLGGQRVNSRLGGSTADFVRRRPPRSACVAGPPLRRSCGSCVRGRPPALAAAGLVEAALQRLAEVDHVGRPLGRLLGDDLLAGFLGLDPVAQLLDVGVLVLLRIPVARQRVEQLHRHLAAPSAPASTGATAARRSPGGAPPRRRSASSTSPARRRAGGSP